MTRYLLLLAVLSLAACVATGPAVSQQLDPQTGATVRQMRTPLVFYRDNNARAAYARDFAYVAPVAVNQMGEDNYFLWLGIWSSLEHHIAAEQRDGFESIVLFADGEPMRLDVEGWTLSTIGVSQPVYNKPTASAADAYYAVTLDQIRLIAQSTDLRLSAGTDRSVTYEPWDSQKTAMSELREFVRRENF
jgi:hypothetical protein